MTVFFKRFIKLIFGLFLYGLGIVITMKANLGFAPWEVFHWGLGNTIGISVGTATILTGLFIGILAALLGEKLGLGTLLNMILIGIFMDLLLALNIIPQTKGLITGAAVMITGLFTIAFGSYFYINSAFGAGPRDSLMVAMKRKTKLPIGICRGILEVTVVFTGFILGGPVGIGTILAAFGIGFCIQIVFSLMKFEATAVKHDTINLKQLFNVRYFKNN
ncbi:YczE/YyaS/YitT family protein [Rubrolithibacter danxiaensis]|uniref:YczE/YyaS/YitT family protein n=1 Tax=Rubrolithibacter danxiaensis TaxID=3390805 RepID=UPI003BF86FAB